MKRKSSVAGGFYPRFKDELNNIIETSFKDKKFGSGKDFTVPNEDKPRQTIAGICPHAGYVYSGPAAAYTFQTIFSEKIPDCVIVLGTQHTGYYKIALMEEGQWSTPLGDISIDNELATLLLKENEEIKDDDSAFMGYPHGREHNIEVQLPFIKYISNLAKKNIKFVPIKVGVTQFKKLKDLGESIARSISQSSGKDIVIIASSDMTHKQPTDYMNPAKDLERMKEADNKVINAIRDFNWKETLENALNTTVCGPQTITTAMIASKELGANKSIIQKYYTSYEKMGGQGPCEYSVGYLSAVFQK